MKDYTKLPWRKISLEEITTPRFGKICITGNWWIVTPDNYVLYYGVSPQCNSSKDITEHLVTKLHEGCSVRYIEVAYEDHNCRNYVF